MTDGEKIDHAAGCLREVRKLCERGQQIGDADLMEGIFRKIHQVAGFGLDNMEAPMLVPPVKQKTFEERAREEALAIIERRKYAGSNA